MNTKRPLSWCTRLSIALKVAKALEELHEHQILHGQIRSHHVLFDEKTKVVKLTDFSHANFETGPRYFHGRDINTPKGVIYERWRAPEEFLELTTSSATDIYQFGNLLYELATRSRPFSTISMHRIAKSLCAGVTSEIPEKECPFGVREIIQLCWAFDPAKRPKASELIERLKALIVLLPKDAGTIDQEFSALNSRFTFQCKLAFFMGFHKRVGQNSSLLTLSQDEIYDKNVLPIIFGLSS